MQSYFIPAPSETELRGNMFGDEGFIYPDREHRF